MKTKFGPGREVALGAVLALLRLATPATAGEGFLQITNGYFWDSATGEYFIPRGVAYQVWNPPVGANQSFAQLDYDLVEFKKMHANSVRCEITWGEIHKGPNEYDWHKPDHLIAKAEELGLRLFILIAYQYPPAWFPKEYRGVNNQYTTSNIPTEVAANVLSDVINYEHPEARRIYANHLAAVTGRYKNSRAVGGWIVGNEYAYFDLWEDPKVFYVHRFIGYDPISQAAFRDYLRQAYQTNIAALNANWQRNFSSFDAVEMPRQYPVNRVLPGYHDLIQWRKRSIGDFVGVGAAAVKKADPNHLITYSMVGGIFTGQDANYPCEDAATIVARCAAAGGPLDFWSINNYAWAAVGSEMRSADFGITKYREQSGLPVMISETGHSSTETIPGFEGASVRQAKALPSTMWESLMSGAIGTHFFHWSDRNLFSSNTVFYRENGFGIVEETRKIKPAVYTNIVTMFRQMENLRIDRLLGGSTNPPPDIQYFWSTNSDMVWPRANQENAMMWGALKRLGYQPALLDDAAFERGDYARAPVLLLSRCLQMDPAHLQQIADAVLPAGIHVHAETDLPGQTDAYNRTNTNWGALMNSIFGVNVANLSGGLHAIVTNDFYAPLKLKAVAALGPITVGANFDLKTWRIVQGVAASTAKVILTDSGYEDKAPNTPALLVNTGSPGSGRTALNTFALGDSYAASGTTASQWDLRYNLLRAIYRDHFGRQPVIDLSGTGSKYVLPDYRLLQNGSVLISLLNESSNAVTVAMAAPSLLTGLKVERIITGGVLTENSNGSLTVALGADELALLYAYPTSGPTDASLINTSVNKLWFEDAPVAVWPNGAPYGVSVGYDTQETGLQLRVSLDQLRPAQRIYGYSAPVAVQGKGRQLLQVPVPDADPNDPDYLSSRKGAEYVFYAWLEKDGTVVSETSMPVRLVWGVHPVAALPAAPVPGQTYPVTLEWEELPSYTPGDPTLLDRAELWDSLEATRQRYQVVLELKANGLVVASDKFLTRTGTASHNFVIKVPPGTAGPFTWAARLETAPNVLSHDIEDAFEGRLRGAMWPSNLNYNFVAPWVSFPYASPNTGKVDIWQNVGVNLEGFNGTQAAFVVATNPPAQFYSGFNLIYVFPQEWALPADVNQWTNWTFSFDFRETHHRACVLAMQIKSTNEKWLEYTANYNPATNEWNHLEATLNKFVRPPIPGEFLFFDPQHVKTIVVNISMSEVAQYVGVFDNIRFLGPETNQTPGVTRAVYISDNDSLGELRVQRTGSLLTISWTGSGTLETADDPAGPWADNPTAKSPVLTPPSEHRKFYRLKR